MPDNFLDELEKYEKQEAGGGVICKFRMALGYKAFIVGAKNEATFWEFTPGDEASEDVAKAKAAKAAQDAGVKNPRRSVVFIMDKTTVKGRAVQWKEDRWHVYPLWTAAYQENKSIPNSGIIKRQIKELGLSIGEYWGRFKWVEDPSGRMGEDKEGKPRVELIAYPAELYPNEAAAEAAAGGTTVAESFNVAEWEELKDDIAAAVKEQTKALKSPTKAKEAVAAEYQLTVAQLEQIIA